MGTFSIFDCQVDTDRVNLQPLWLTHIPLICCPLSESHPWQLSANDRQQKGSQSRLNAWHHWRVSFWPAVHMFLYAFITWSHVVINAFYVFSLSQHSLQPPTYMLMSCIMVGWLFFIQTPTSWDEHIPYLLNLVLCKIGYASFLNNLFYII